MNSNSNHCAICFEPLCSSKSPIGAVIPCGHLFHVECFNQWEGTNMQRQMQHNINVTSRNVVVKCPSCNTVSRVNSRDERLLKIYLNLEEMIISDSDDSDDEGGDSDDDDDDDNDEDNLERQRQGQLQEGNATAKNTHEMNNSKSNEPQDNSCILLLSDSEEEDFNQNICTTIPIPSANTSSRRNGTQNNTERTPPSSSFPSRVSSTSSSNNNSSKSPPSNKKKLKRRIKVLRKKNESLKEKARSYNDLNLKYSDLQKDIREKEEQIQKIQIEYHRDLTKIESLKRNLEEKNYELRLNQSTIESLQDQTSVYARIQCEMEAEYKRKVDKLQMNSMDEFNELDKNHKSLESKYHELTFQFTKINKQKEQLERRLEQYQKAMSKEVDQKVQVMKRNQCHQSQSSYSRNKKILKQTIESTMNDFDQMEKARANQEKEQQQKKDRKHMIQKSSIHARMMKQAAVSNRKSATKWDMPKVQMTQNDVISKNVQLNHMKSSDGNRKRGSTFPQQSHGGSRQRNANSSSTIRPGASILSTSSLLQLNRSNSYRKKDNDIRSIFKK